MRNGQKLNPQFGLFLAGVLRSIFGAGVFIEGCAGLEFHLARAQGIRA